MLHQGLLRAVLVRCVPDSLLNPVFSVGAHASEHRAGCTNVSPSVFPEGMNRRACRESCRADALVTVSGHGVGIRVSDACMRRSL